MDRRGNHAVVLGASMSGLLAARVLADFYDRVTLIERDELPAVGETRRGVPQASHAHVLLPSGADAMEELLPGLLDTLAEDGVPVVREPREYWFEMAGHLFVREGVAWDPTYQPSRPLLEGRVLERVRALPSVSVREGYDVVGLLTDTATSEVIGARVQRRVAGAEIEDVAADLVVAATGRSGRSGHWLEAMGYPTPSEDELKVDIMYASCHLRVPEQAMGGVRFVLIGPLPDRPSGMAFFEQEQKTWVLTAAGYAGSHPPTEWEAYLDHLSAYTPPQFHHVIKRSERLDDVRTHRFPANLRRRYDKLDRFPAGYLVTGDAVCSFNPIYGQGMSVAALEAVALRQALSKGGHPDRLARDFFKAASKPTKVAWDLAVGSDLTIPVVPGPRPLQVRVVNRWVDQFMTASEVDHGVADVFIQVSALQQPAWKMMTPGTAVRVVRSARRARRRTPSSAVAGGGPGEAGG